MSQQSKQKIIGLIVIVLLAGAATAAVVVTRDSADSSQSVVNETTNTSDSPSSSTTDITYKNGTYSADGEYRSPAGTEKINVTVTLEADTIKDVTITSDASGTSAQYQNAFKSGIKSIVVGKDIDSVNVSRVSSSSLTSTGFNRALDTIKNDAKA